MNTRAPVVLGVEESGRRYVRLQSDVFFPGCVRPKCLAGKQSLRLVGRPFCTRSRRLRSAIVLLALRPVRSFVEGVTRLRLKAGESPGGSATHTPLSEGTNHTRGCV